MTFETHIPAAPLSKYIESMVFYADYFPEHFLEKLLPDGSIYLLIDFKDEPKKCFHSNDFTEFESFTRSYVSGQHKGFIYIESTNDSSMMVVQFKAGGASPFFDCPISEMNECVRHSEYYFGDDLNNLRDELNQLKDITVKFQRMEQFLIDRLHPTDENTPLELILDLLKNKPFQISTRELAETAGISQKHLISLFDRHVGLTPKALTRIFRFQQVIQQVEEQETIDWLQIATDCGYYDQSHFVKDFYTFSGINPSQYPEARGEYLNYIPVRD